VSVLTTGAFWAAAGERAAKSAAQFAVSILTVASVTPADIDWQQVAAGSGLAALVSVLMSVASVGVGHDGPSLTSERLTSPPVEPVAPPNP
jgi:hypothetical protein